MPHVSRKGIVIYAHIFNIFCSDLHAVNGDWPLATKLPLVGGHEGAGVVVAKGSLVEDIEIGDYAVRRLFS
jgi:D-arabinose 1-dehydrogenase-like Zn-dependent alcohol dehydrogenase